ncbi:MAG: 3-phosphoshikimate 1-carboxyvinyltransferase [Halanaeroarchaeum sp.]
MDVTVSRSRVAGRVRAPPSKSYTHRAVLAAGYAEGALLREPLVSADTRATMRAVEHFGGSVDVDDDAIEVTGFAGRPAVPAAVIDCANSGTTMRLTTATAALAPGTTVLTGDESLRSRPHGPLLDAIGQLGGTARSTRANGRAPLVVDGPISGGTVEIPGDVSSQFVTALLMAGAVTDEGIDLALTTQLKSSPYVAITLALLDEFGVDARQTNDGYAVGGGQFYEPIDGEYTIPGDFSSASYLLAAGVVAGRDEVVVTGAHPNPQGDTAIVSILDDMGAEIEWNRADGVLRVRESTLDGTTVDVADTPDLLPTVAVLGAVADGTTRITNCEHVRYKETDRVAAMAEELSALGASVDEEVDVLTIRGRESDLVGTRVSGRGDHRLVMALAVAGLVADGETTIAGAEHVDVSFPDFFDVLYNLGATVEH